MAKKKRQAPNARCNTQQQAARDKAIYDLRNNGMEWEPIGKKFGLAESGARVAYDRHLKEVGAKYEQENHLLRIAHTERLEKQIDEATKRLKKSKDPAEARLIVKCLEDIRKIWGADAPTTTKTELTGSVEVPPAFTRKTGDEGLDAKLTQIAQDLAQSKG